MAAAAQTSPGYARVDLYHRRELNAFLEHVTNLDQFMINMDAIDPVYANLPPALIPHCSETLARRNVLMVRRPGSLLLAHVTNRNEDAFALATVLSIAMTRRPSSDRFIDGQQHITLVEIVCQAPPPDARSKPLRHFFAMLPYHSRTTMVDWYQNAFPVYNAHVIARADCLTFIVDQAVFTVPPPPVRPVAKESLATRALRAYATDLVMRHLRSGRVLELARADVAAAGVSEDLVPRVFAEVFRQLQFRGAAKVGIAQPADCKYHLSPEIRLSNVDFLSESAAILLGAAILSESTAMSLGLVGPDFLSESAAVLSESTATLLGLMRPDAMSLRRP